MNIKIHTHQLDMSDNLREYAERRIADSIGHIYKRQAGTLDIEFSDASGGREKACKVTFFVPPAKTLVASAQDPDPYAAVDLAAEKISREVRRYKEKRIAERRHNANAVRAVENAMDGGDLDGVPGSDEAVEDKAWEEEQRRLYPEAFEPPKDEGADLVSRNRPVD